MHGTPNLPRFTNVCQGVPHFNERLTDYEKFVYLLNSVALIDPGKWFFVSMKNWKVHCDLVKDRELEITSSSQQKPSYVPRKKTLQLTSKENIKRETQSSTVSSICSENLQHHEDSTHERGQWAVAFDSGNKYIKTNGTEFLPETRSCLNLLHDWSCFLTSRSTDNK